MKWSILFVACAALIVNNGCCCSRNACSPCGQTYGGGYGYGATYAPSTCPGGNCGPVYQSGSLQPTMQQAYVPTSQTAYTPYAPYSTTASLDHMPIR